MLRRSGSSGGKGAGPTLCEKELQVEVVCITLCVRIMSTLVDFTSSYSLSEMGVPGRQGPTPSMAYLAYSPLWIERAHVRICICVKMYLCT